MKTFERVGNFLKIRHLEVKEEPPHTYTTYTSRVGLTLIVVENIPEYENHFLTVSSPTMGTISFGPITLSECEILKQELEEALK